jgi:hypothetical protein
MTSGSGSPSATGVLGGVGQCPGGTHGHVQSVGSEFSHGWVGGDAAAAGGAGSGAGGLDDGHAHRVELEALRSHVTSWERDHFLKGARPMWVTVYGVLAVSFMMSMYALESRGPRYVLGFAFGCLLSSSYGFLSGAWPFGVVEAVWSVIAVQRYRGIARDGAIDRA